MSICDKKRIYFTLIESLTFEKQSTRILCVDCALSENDVVLSYVFWTCLKCKLTNHRMFETDHLEHKSDERIKKMYWFVKNRLVKLHKLQQQSLRVISDSLKTISMQILETKTHVQSIQLHIIRLKMSFKQRMKNHRHDTLIKSFCEQIKHRLFKTRERRKRRVHETSAERKIRWTLKMCIKLLEKKREENASFDRALIKLFLTEWKHMWRAYQTRNRRRICETLMTNITFKKIKLHKDLTKSKNFLVTHIKTKRIELTDYFFFRRVLIVLFSSCIYDHQRQTLKRVLLFCANWFERRQHMLRKEETTNMKNLFNSKKRLKAAVNWLIKINLLIQFSLIKEYLDWINISFV
jgi:hypothetical protein